MLYISPDMEILDRYTEEQLIEEAIETNSTELEVTVEKFINYDEKHCEYNTEVLETYSVNLMEYVNVEEIIEYAHFCCKTKEKIAKHEVKEIK